MRPLVKATSWRICIIPSQPARLTAGLLNLEQMSRSLRSFLLTELSVVFALSQRNLHNWISLRKLHFVPMPEEFRRRPVGKSAQSCPFVFISRSHLENRILRSRKYRFHEATLESQTTGAPTPIFTTTVNIALRVYFYLYQLLITPIRFASVRGKPIKVCTHALHFSWDGRPSGRWIETGFEEIGAGGVQQTPDFSQPDFLRV